MTSGVTADGGRVLDERHRIMGVGGDSGNPLAGGAGGGIADFNRQLAHAEHQGCEGVLVLEAGIRALAEPPAHHRGLAPRYRCHQGAAIRGPAKIDGHSAIQQDAKGHPAPPNFFEPAPGWKLTKTPAGFNPETRCYGGGRNSICHGHDRVRC